MTKSMIHILQLTSLDVISGRGHDTNTQNTEYRRLVNSFVGRYKKACNEERRTIYQQVIYEVERNGGRFLQRRKHVFFTQLTPHQKLNKVRQSLRDKAKNTSLLALKTPSPDEAIPALVTSMEKDEIAVPTSGAKRQTATTPHSVCAATITGSNQQVENLPNNFPGIQDRPELEAEIALVLSGELRHVRFN